jgi:rare lipoprotein A
MMLSSNLNRVSLGVLAGLLFLAGCQTSQVPLLPKVVKEPGDSAPLMVPPGLAQLPDPEVVEVEPSRYGNPQSYTVAGRTYQVMASASGYVEEGIASWYGTKFHGRRTSSGEPFDMFALTAAHRSLPIPAFARITNLDNGLTTVVRINDRGPFHADRIIDLSYAAAVKLGFASSGTGRVRVQVLEPVQNFYLQAGAFTSLASADSLKAQIQALIGHQAFVVKVPGDQLYRVRIGPVQGRDEADRVQRTIASRTSTEPLIVPF